MISKQRQLGSDDLQHFFIYVFKVDLLARMELFQITYFVLFLPGCLNPLANVTAETLFEYKWPLEGRNSEHFFLQEQASMSLPFALNVCEVLSSPSAKGFLSAVGIFFFYNPF
jgi:hypothetical protein